MWNHCPLSARIFHAQWIYLSQGQHIMKSFYLQYQHFVHVCFPQYLLWMMTCRNNFSVCMWFKNRRWETMISSQDFNQRLRRRTCDSCRGSFSGFDLQFKSFHTQVSFSTGLVPLVRPVCWLLSFQPTLFIDFKQTTLFTVRTTL